jgi:hypothetical protein
LFLEGLDDKNLTPQQRSEVISQIEQRYGLSDDEMEKILKQAHELPYGDVLVSFLKKFVDVFNRHTHPYSGLPPTLNIADVQTLDPNWDNMLSKSVRIN